MAFITLIVVVDLFTAVSTRKEAKALMAQGKKFEANKVRENFSILMGFSTFMLLLALFAFFYSLHMIPFLKE